MKPYKFEFAEIARLAWVRMAPAGALVKGIIGWQ